MPSLKTYQVTPRISELQVFRMEQEIKSTGITDQRENSMKKSTREKRKLDSNKTDGQSRAKRQKDTAQHMKVNIEKDKIQAVDLGEKRVEGGEIHGSKPETTSKKETSNPSPKKPKHYSDQCTAFISNLNFKASHLLFIFPDCEQVYSWYTLINVLVVCGNNDLQTTDEDLRAFFSDVGGVVAIRILKDKFTGKSRGLAYVDFVDDSHLAAAVAKNKQNLHGKRVSILRSDPQGKRKGTVGHSNTSKHGAADNQTTEGQPSDAKDSGGSQKQTSQKHSDDTVQLKGRNTFAMPRSVRPLGWTKTKPGGPDEAGDDNKPKSNDEFRKMFMKA